MNDSGCITHSKVKKIRYLSTLFHQLGYSFGTKTDDPQDILRKQPTTFQFPTSFASTGPSQ